MARSARHQHQPPARQEAESRWNWGPQQHNALQGQTTATDEALRLAQCEVSESCACGSTFKMSLPGDKFDSLIKGVNTWRKYHSCTLDQPERTPSNAEAEN